MKFVSMGRVRTIASPSPSSSDRNSAADFPPNMMGSETNRPCVEADHPSGYPTIGMYRGSSISIENFSRLHPRPNSHGSACTSSNDHSIILLRVQSTAS